MRRNYTLLLNGMAVELPATATAMTAIRLAHAQPQRVGQLVLVGGWVERKLDHPRMAEAVQQNLARMRADWAGYLDEFFSISFTEPHSTKPYEDAVRDGWSTDGETVAMALAGWMGHDMSEACRQLRCPTLVIHGDQFDVVVYNMSFSWVVDSAWVTRLAHAHRDKGVAAVVLHEQRGDVARPAHDQRHVVGLPVPAPAPPGHGVVLLHGLARGPRSFARLAEVLRRRGYVVANVGYNSTSAPVRSTASNSVRQPAGTGSAESARPQGPSCQNSCAW